MYKSAGLLFCMILLTSCNKEKENIIWERSFVAGKAVSVRTAGDSGYVSCGESEGKAYLLFLDKNREKVMEYQSETAGILTSALASDGLVIAAGSSDGKMYLAGIGMSGELLWDTVFTSSFRIDYSSLADLGDGNFMALGSADPDSTVVSASGISFVQFNSSGTISSKSDITSITFMAARSFALDDGGNIFLALTRSSTGVMLKAGLAKYNPQVQKLWEKDLYNNPSFGAASLDIILDAGGNPIVSGRTELSVSAGKENSAFIARYFAAADSLTKNYLEYSNRGYSIRMTGSGDYAVLNSNCFIVNLIDQDIEITGIIRTYNSCDSKQTDAIGYSMDITPDGNIIMAGSRGGSFYLAVKSFEALSPV